MPPALLEFDLLTLTEVAGLLHCSKTHLSKMIVGRVPFVDMSRTASCVVSPDEIKEVQI